MTPVNVQEQKSETGGGAAAAAAAAARGAGLPSPLSATAKQRPAAGPRPPRRPQRPPRPSAAAGSARDPGRCRGPPRARPGTPAPEGGGLTHGDQVSQGLQHHVVVLGPLRRLQQPPLLPAEVHGHVQEGHGFLQCHTSCPSQRGRESLVGTLQQSPLCWGCPGFGGLLAGTGWGLKETQRLILTRPAARAQAGGRAPTLQGTASATNKLPPQGTIPEPAWPLPRHVLWGQFLPAGRGRELHCDQSFLRGHPGLGEEAASQHPLPGFGRHCAHKGQRLLERRLEPLNTDMPEALPTPLVAGEPINSVLRYGHG